MSKRALSKDTSPRFMIYFEAYEKQQSVQPHAPTNPGSKITLENRR